MPALPAFNSTLSLIMKPESYLTAYPTLRYDILGGLPNPNCPYPHTFLPSITDSYADIKPLLDESVLLYNPTSSFTYLTLSITCIALGIYVGLKLNVVRV